MDCKCQKGQVPIAESSGSGGVDRFLGLDKSKINESVIEPLKLM
jgi:hypothetical protein